MSSTVCRGLAALLAAACGGSDKSGGADESASRMTRTQSTDDAEEEPSGDIEVEGLQGHLDPAEIDAGVAPHQTALARCYRGQARRLKFLGGKLTLKTVVGPDGAVKLVQVAESNLGAWPVEKCLLGIARAMTFAKPKGGNRQAEFTLPLDFPTARGGVDMWEPERIERVVGEKKNQAELEKCGLEAPSPRDVTVTLYIGNRGEVKSVGFSSPAAEPIDDAWGDCAAAVIASWKFDDPRGVIGKTGFRFHAE